MGKIDRFRQAEGMMKPKHEDVAEVVKDDSKKQTRQCSIEVDVKDIDKLESAVFRLSSRDNVLYKKKDIHIAMVKYFLDAIENNINKIKVEKN